MGTRESVATNGKTLKAEAVKLLSKKFWPVVVHPPGVEREGRAATTGKEPVGSAWGLQRITLVQINERFRYYPDARLGVCLGPERGPGGEWLADFEGDGDQANQSLVQLLNSDEIDTASWSSTRGGHSLFTVDGERLLTLLMAAGATEGRGTKVGVYKLAALPDLEIRVGGRKPDGTIKQIQSVIPPSPGTDGKPRQWIRGLEALRPLPEAAYQFLESLAQKHAAEAARKPQGGNGKAASDRPAADNVEARVIAYLAKCPPAISGQGGHKTAFAVACRIGPGFDLSEDDAVRLLLEHWNPECVPEWTEAEIRHKVEDAYKEETRRGFLLNAERPTAPEGGFVGFVGTFPQVRPVFVPLRPVPRMDPLLIPKPFRTWLEDIATRASCPLDLPAASVTVYAGSVVGRSVAIRPKRKDDWTVVANLWGMGVLPPGWLKTHSLDEPRKPLSRLEAEAREAHVVALNEFAITEAVASAQADAAKSALKDAAKNKKPGTEKTEAELRDLASKAMAKPCLKPPTMKRYVVNDATTEKFGELLSENPNGLLQFRDELMGFLRSLEREGRENDRSFYLEGWNGTGSYSYDRIGRGSIYIPSHTISVMGGIQPGRLAEYIRSAGSGERDDGLISRFQLAVFPDTDTPYEQVDRWPDKESKNRAFGIFKKLAELNPAAIGAVQDGPGEIPYLRFTEDAQTFFDEWFCDLEVRVRGSQEMACLTSHLSKYRSLLPSLALLFHLIEIVCGEAEGPVSLASARRAAAWCDYLECHARRIYQLAFDGDPEPAQRLAERIKNSLSNPFTARDVTRKGWKSLDTAEEVDRALGLLAEHGWVVEEEVPAGPGGGRPTTRYHINPAVRTDDPATGEEGGE